MKRPQFFKWVTTLSCAGLLAGCAGSQVMTAIPADHPANPDAAIAPYAPPANVLARRPASPPSPSSASQPQNRMKGMDMGHMNMNHGSINQMDMGEVNMQGMDMNGMNHKDANNPPKQKGSHP